jgi:hypothetical protein
MVTMTGKKNINTQSNISEFIQNSKNYYKEIEDELKNNFFGKYVAMSYEIKGYEIGETLTEALKKAKEKYPNKLFYVIQVGSDATFSIQTMDKNKLIGTNRRWK